MPRRSGIRTRSIAAWSGAPFDGVVLSGDLMDQRNAAKKQGDELFTVAALSSANGLRAELSVSERDVQDLHEGQHGELATSALPSEKHPFTIDRIEPIGQPKDGDNTFTVYGRLDQPSPTWRPGMAGEARVDIRPRAFGLDLDAQIRGLREIQIVDVKPAVPPWDSIPKTHASAPTHISPNPGTALPN